ncbi:MAG TPA: toprim domain-containing protein [Sedimentisphaerales bacterium]|nr:toprim domain-containing protein [Sedimentisphaerales bacterium]
MRAESSRPCKSGGWFHTLGEPVKYKPAPKKSKPVPVRDFAALSSQYVENLINIDRLANELGVSIRSLERLDTGWNGNITFPMRDGRERIIGIRIRGSKGKWCVEGSRQGLFWPEGVYSGSDWPLVICEGPTDCAALLDMEFDVIGRPSCMGGTEHIIEFLKGRRRDVIIMADKDPPKERPDGSVWFPGQEGAARLSKAILPFVRSLRIIKPPFFKDIREWHKAGATKEAVVAVINNTRCVA